MEEVATFEAFLVLIIQIDYQLSTILHCIMTVLKLKVVVLLKQNTEEYFYTEKYCNGKILLTIVTHTPAIADNIITRNTLQINA